MIYKSERRNKSFKNVFSRITSLHIQSNTSIYQTHPIKKPDRKTYVSLCKRCLYFDRKNIPKARFFQRKIRKQSIIDTKHKKRSIYVDKKIKIN